MISYVLPTRDRPDRLAQTAHDLLGQCVDEAVGVQSVLDLLGSDTLCVHAHERAVRTDAAGDRGQQPGIEHDVAV